MRYHFHVCTGKSIEYDEEGYDFASLEIARYHAVQTIRAYFLAHRKPRREVIDNACLCITDQHGNVEQLPFADAFLDRHGDRSAHFEPGHA
jgi:hypothetical protein